jgi:SAM-dependent methyltransferase
VPDLPGKRLLEIGASFGSFLALARSKGIDAWGIDPEWKRIRAGYLVWGHPLEYRHNISISVGEHLPFRDESFDVIYSTNVLEHVLEPEIVLQEALRVLKPGGYLQFIFPNYGSIWDGHYRVFWIPYAPRWLIKLYLRLLNHNPRYVDTLQIGLNPIWLARTLRRMRNVRVISKGLRVFQERMVSPDFGGCISYERLTGVLRVMRRSKGLIWVLQGIARIFAVYTPFILTLQKLPVAQGNSGKPVRLADSARVIRC